MTTGLELITKALQKNGVLVKSETPDSDEASDALDALNMLVSAWANDSMMIIARTQESFNLTANDEVYTIGSGADFNTERPLFIVEAHVRNSNIDYPLEIITDEDYNLIPDKQTSSIPRFLNYSNAYPTATIKLWPKPDIAYTLFLTSEKTITSFTLTGDVSLPPGWERALIFNLAVDLAPDYGEAVSSDALARCIKLADESRSDIRKAIMRNRTMDVPLSRTLPNKKSNYSGYPF